MTKSDLYGYIVGLISVALIVIWIAALSAEPTLLAVEWPPNLSSNPDSGEEASIKQGKRLYRGLCARCHGRNGEGGGRFAGSRNLRQYNRGYSKFVSIVKEGAKKMPAWGGILSGDDINRIGAYLETIALAEAKWEDPPK